MGHIFFSASKRDLFCFFLHIDLALGLWSRFGKISFSFRSWYGPFAGILPMQATGAKCVGQQLSRWVVTPFGLVFLFLFHCTMSFGGKKIFWGLGHDGLHMV
ncbi:hypothetical protein V8C35DRAFT_57749 [Trichoderma chlorosporum]